MPVKHIQPVMSKKEIEAMKTNTQRISYSKNSQKRYSSTHANIRNRQSKNLMKSNESLNKNNLSHFDTMTIPHFGRNSQMNISNTCVNKPTSFYIDNRKRHTVFEKVSESTKWELSNRSVSQSDMSGLQQYSLNEHMKTSINRNSLSCNDLQNSGQKISSYQRKDSLKPPAPPIRYQSITLVESDEKAEISSQSDNDHDNVSIKYVNRWCPRFLCFSGKCTPRRKFPKIKSGICFRR